MDLGLKVNLPKWTLIQVKHHLRNKPWRIVDQYLHPTSDQDKIIIHLIAERFCTIQIGEILGHIQLVTFSQAFIKGKNTIHFLHSCIY